MSDLNNNSLGHNEIESRFGYHKAAIEGPSASQNNHSELRKLFKALAYELDSTLPEGREKTVAFQELETASMWAHKALARSNPLAEE